MNEYDSDRIIDLVKKAGFSKTETISETDCYILNTCHIREKSTENYYCKYSHCLKLPPKINMGWFGECPLHFVLVFYSSIDTALTLINSSSKWNSCTKIRNIFSS